MTEAYAEPVRECLQLIAYGVHQRKFGDARKAAKALASAVLASQRFRVAGQLHPLRALAIFNLSLLAPGVATSDETRHLRDRAAALLPSGVDCESLSPPELLLYQDLMAQVLTELGEHRRAIPYCEAVAQNIGTPEVPAGLAHRAPARRQELSQNRPARSRRRLPARRHQDLSHASRRPALHRCFARSGQRSTQDRSR